MKRIIFLFFLTGLLTTGEKSLQAQNLEVDGSAKITMMDPASASAQPVARETDGTLSLMSSGTIYSVGDFAQGGVVFWVSVNGAHGKVVSIYSVLGVEWSNMTSTGVGSFAQSDINGAGNTVAIMMQSGHLNSAARHCADLAYAGYDDWYLPSKDELGEVYSNRTVIDTAATSSGGEVLSGITYWSSTEGSSNSASIQFFATGLQFTSAKNVTAGVRAIRAF